MVDRSAKNRRYDATSNTLVRVTSQRLSTLDHHDETGEALPEGVISGIMNNCAGGQTPWGTIIAAEENVQNFYGDVETAWDDTNKFVSGAGFDPGSNISPIFEASTSAKARFGQIPDPNGRHNRDFYGYIAEIDPGVDPKDYYDSVHQGGNGMGHLKIGSMGRVRWENATFVVDSMWRLIPHKPIVMYGGDDRRGGRVYKLVSKYPYTPDMTRGEIRALLDEGTLYVAHFAGLDNTTGYTLLGGGVPTEETPGKGRWVLLSTTSTDIAPNAAALGDPAKTVGDALRDVQWNGIGGFSTDDDVRVALFTAVNKLGVMELNRPEDVEWNPKDLSGTPRLYVTFTNHTRQVALDQNGVLFDPAEHPEKSPKRNDKVGSIFAIQEVDPASPEQSRTFTYFAVFRGSEGREAFDVTNPDNLMIDREGGVWFGTDGNFDRNGTADGLYYLDLDPTHKAGQPGIVHETFGKAFRVAAGPSDSETTGPAFSADMRTIFFNVQHPGSGVPSTWPNR